MMSLNEHFYLSSITEEMQRDGKDVAWGWDEGRWRKTGLHTNRFGPGAELRGPAKAWKKSGGLAKTSSSSSSKSARVFNRSGGRRGELLLS